MGVVSLRRIPEKVDGIPKRILSIDAKPKPEIVSAVPPKKEPAAGSIE